ncbi:MAG: AbiTii domain-containing protein [Thermoguttaceae bacterium]
MTQPSLVIELQQLASEKRNDISDVLRKAMMVATKLDLPDFRQWIECELDGYPDDTPVPKYRIVQGTVYGRDTLTNRLVPYAFPPKMASTLQNVNCREPIAIFAALQGKHTGIMQKPLAAEVVNVLLQDQDEFEHFQPERHIPNTTPDRIIDAVRSALLQWALRLEKEGILGEGMTFSSVEKNKAMSSQQIRIDKFQGILGDVSNSWVQQQLEMDVKKNDFESLAAYLRSLAVPDDDIEELKQAVTEDGPIPESHSVGSKVTNWLGGMMVKAGKLTGPLATGVSSGLLVEAIKAYYGL